MNAANLVINANTDRDLETRLAAQGVLSAARVTCNDVQVVTNMEMDAQVDQLVVEFEEQLQRDSDIIEVTSTTESAQLAHLQAARIVASSAQQQSLLVSLALEAGSLNNPLHKLHHILLTLIAQGADFVTGGRVTYICVAKRLAIAGRTVDVLVVISLDQQAIAAQRLTWKQ